MLRVNSGILTTGEFTGDGETGGDAGDQLWLRQLHLP